MPAGHTGRGYKHWLVAQQPNPNKEINVWTAKKPNLNDKSITHTKYKQECDNKANYPNITLNDEKLTKT